MKTLITIWALVVISSTALGVYTACYIHERTQVTYNTPDVINLGSEEKIEALTVYDLLPARGYMQND